MSSQCQLPCPASSAAQTSPCPSPCALGDPDPCPAQDSHSCPEQNFQPTASPAELCTPGTCVEASCPVKLPAPATEPCTIDTPGMCVMTFPLQKNILTVELCPPDSAPLPADELCPPETLGSCLESVCLGEPCTLEVLEPPCRARGMGMSQPCPSDPCPGSTEPPLASRGAAPELGDAEGTAKDCRSPSSFRLNSRTSSIVERCLARCQSWFRGKN